MARKSRLKEGYDIHVNDPFKYLAHGLATDKEDIWEEKPVDIQTFIEAKKFLNLKWDGRKGCRPKIMEIAVNLAADNVREAMLLLGKGSGKDFISSILHLYGIYKCLCMYSPQAYYGLAPGSAIYFINVARNEIQAKNVFFKEFLGHLMNCAWFENKYSEPGVQHVNFVKNVVALSGNSQAFSWLGYNTLQWVGDEIAFFLDKADDDDSAESKAQECWESAFGSCMTRFSGHYKMIGITTPRYDDDFVMQKFYELKHRAETDKNSYVAQAATWDINPLLSKESFKNALERDYRRTMRDFGAQPMGVIETFWGDPDFVDKNPCEICRQCPIYQQREINTDPYACFEYENCTANAYIGNGRFRDWFIPDPNAEYYMHFDLSKNKDKTAFSLAHIVDWVRVKLDPYEVTENKRKVAEDKADGEQVERIGEEDLYEDRPLIKIDFIGWVDPIRKIDTNLLKNGEIYYAGLLKMIVNYLLDQGFNIVKITVDQFQSHQFKQSIEDRGIETDLLSLDRTDEVPVNAKKCFVENRVEYPYCRIFAKEAKYLKYIKGNKVDHPTGKGKDIIDSVFGTVYNCEVNTIGKSTFEVGEVQSPTDIDRD